MPVKIQAVERFSPAHRAGIKPGQVLISINENAISDVLDYRFYMMDRVLKLSLLDRKQRLRQITVKKDEYEDLGLEFETYLMDKQHHCKNKCIFCFVDQMPPGMREQLYFKDDDERLSFLFGNYVTLTNLKQADIDRIIKMHISPINISVHTTNPELRVKMMKNPRAGECLSYIRQLTDAGIKVNTQLVLCPGINDGEELKRSLRELSALYPNLESIAAVPVGLTRFRQDLYELKPYTKQQAGETIRIIHAFADEFYEQHGVRLAYPADEFFLKAELPIPEPAYYGDYNQLENGVGLLALLKEEFERALEDDTITCTPGRTVSIATGTAVGPFITELAQRAKQRFPGLDCRVHIIRNEYFGETITVAGLITATDLIAQLKGKHLGDTLLIPRVMLRFEQDRFLDDITLEALEEELGVSVGVVENDGFELLEKMTGG
ncbi:radical SAM protein [Candidatus Soleaferrea massiliensis]|uniref:radical SAM protein n=1 Tax=Candidatus Soleaferrea massiliensis TaxID=1470354 RepID=UPI00058D8AD8|nr:radical SAM protein [Candidatus Soleaferrea massiliensis]